MSAIEDVLRGNVPGYTQNAVTCRYVDPSAHCVIALDAIYDAWRRNPYEELLIVPKQLFAYVSRMFPSMHVEGSYIRIKYVGRPQVR
jgi:hypothetical protein